MATSHEEGVAEEMGRKVTDTRVKRDFNVRLRNVKFNSDGKVHALNHARCLL